MTMKNTALTTTSILDESQADKFITSCVKRNTPIPLAIEDLFSYDEDDDDEKYTVFSCFECYYEDTPVHLRNNIKHLFQCINSNTLINTKIVDSENQEYIRIFINNQFENKVCYLDIPYYYEMQSFLFDYMNREISCNVSFDDIKEYLGL